MLCIPLSSCRTPRTPIPATGIAADTSVGEERKAHDFRQRINRPSVHPLVIAGAFHGFLSHAVRNGRRETPIPIFFMFFHFRTCHLRKMEYNMV